MKHSVIYHCAISYCGWPANHGAWQRGNELLFGFLIGRWAHKSMHNIVEPYQKLLARSKDGGDHWSIEVPNVDFNCEVAYDIFNGNLSAGIVRVCGVYDHGGDYCDEEGGFYYSADFGHSWDGPYKFNGLLFSEAGFINTSRTRIHNGVLYMSAGQRDFWGTDHTFCVQHDGNQFRVLSRVCEDDARAVMPAVAQIENESNPRQPFIVCVMRRRKSGVRSGWLDAFGSMDHGSSWLDLGPVASTGDHNGNPPALVAHGRYLVCCYGNRDEGSLCVAYSNDLGTTWRSGLLRRSEHDSSVDIGYPQLFKRDDGTLVCVYYWLSNDLPQQHIAQTTFQLGEFAGDGSG